MGTWNYVVNDQFTEQYGEGSRDRFVAMLGEVAERVRPGDRDGAMELLDSGFERLGFDMPKLTRDQLAENLTMAEHDRLVVCDDRDTVLAEYALPGGASVHDRGDRTNEEQRRHVDPEDDDRPTYS